MYPILVESSLISFFADCNSTYFHGTLLSCSEAGPQQCKLDLLICFKDSLKRNESIQILQLQNYCGERQMTKSNFCLLKKISIKFCSETHEHSFSMISSFFIF